MTAPLQIWQTGRPLYSPHPGVPSGPCPPSPGAPGLPPGPSPPAPPPQGELPFRGGLPPNPVPPVPPPPAPPGLLPSALQPPPRHQGVQPCVNPMDRKSTRLNSSHLVISYAVFCLKKKKQAATHTARSRRHGESAHGSRGAHPPGTRRPSPHH